MFTLLGLLISRINLVLHHKILWKGERGLKMSIVNSLLIIKMAIYLLSSNYVPDAIPKAFNVHSVINPLNP